MPPPLYATTAKNCPELLEVIPSQFPIGADVFTQSIVDAAEGLIEVSALAEAEGITVGNDEGEGEGAVDGLEGTAVGTVDGIDEGIAVGNDEGEGVGAVDGLP